MLNHYVGLDHSSERSQYVRMEATVSDMRLLMVAAVAGENQGLLKSPSTANQRDVVVISNMEVR